MTTPRLRRPGRTGRVLLAVALALGLSLAGIGLYEYVATELGGPTLVIYTYPSLLGGVDCGGTTAFDTAFNGFASAHHVRIVVDCPTGTLVSTLQEEEDSPAADVVIGLDEITASEAAAMDLLTPYAPPALANVSPTLIDELSPTDAAVPYEYGYLAVDYSSDFANSTDGAVARATFPEFANTSDGWAAQLLTENPTLDITGQEFLAWEIEYYATVLHANWTTFWTAVHGALPPPAVSWGVAFSEFDTTPGQGQMVVSYSTDPAYAKFYNDSGGFNATVSWWNGTAYGWKTVYGIGIVRGTHHLGLAEQFENWWLGGEVQSLLPTTEWEYPANATVGVPADYYDASIDPASIVALNDRISPAQLAADMPGWTETWQEIFSG